MNKANATQHLNIYIITWQIQTRHQSALLTIAITLGSDWACSHSHTRMVFVP